MAEAKKAKPSVIQITPLGLRGLNAHLHCSTGRVQMGASIEVPTGEGEALIAVGRARLATDEPAFVDEPRVLAAIHQKTLDADSQ